jgi:meso-butanediol dehydrogenase / (S,S)-butanediol dehydrogenase / diacetyl reductase
MGRLDGKVALVTGSASGIGRATTIRYAAEGAAVVGLDLAPGESWAETGAAGFVTADVRDEDAVRAAISALLDVHHRLDIVVNAAGVAGGGPVHTVSRADWDRVIGVNLTGTFLVCKHALAPMMTQRGGSIINIASIEGVQGTEGGSSYNASKGGVVLLTKNLAIDYGRLGIRANCICPGFIQTPMFEAVMGSEAMSAFRDRYREEHKLGRFGTADEIANTALFLGSDESSFITGHALVVDGGFTAGTRTALSDVMGLT